MFSPIILSACITLNALGALPPTDSDSIVPPGVQPGEQVVTRSEAGLFDVHVRDIAVADALRLLSIQSRRNITVSSGVTGTVSADIFQVQFEDALEALLTSGGYVWLPKGNFIHVCTAAERDKIVNGEQALEQRIFELGYLNATDIVPIVSQMLSADGSVATTLPPKVEGVALTADAFDEAMDQGLGGKSRAIGDFVIVKDYAPVLARVAEVVERMDVPPQQVLVEAVILRARLNEENALGIDFNVLAGVDFRSLGSVSVGGTNIAPGEVPPPQFENGLSATATDFTGTVPSGGLSVGVITNNVAAFIRAMEETTDLTIVANPKVVAVNGQPARVIVGRQDGYLTTTVTETSAVQNIEFLETGTQILFRPFIGKDGNIRLDIHPEDSSGGLTPENLPFKDTTEVNANVMVKDGHTLVIGGLFRDVVTSRARQVPWFGEIPLLGVLFRGQNDNAVREEVVILITTHIIDPVEAHEESRWLLGEVERRRVLAHRGLMPFGRERLAQAHYAWALEHQNAGRTEEALWDLDIALSLNPGFTEADWLREELTHKATAEPDTSPVRRILDRLIDRELAPQKDTD